MVNELRILIVDDEEELRRSVRSTLETALPEYQCQIEEADNGRVALDKIKSEAFDLVLMDVRMPEMDGLDALVAIKSHDPRTFVVLMTAHSNLNDAVTAIKEGAYDYIEKPVKPKRVEEMVRKCLQAREMVSSLAINNPILDDDIDSEFVGSSQKMREVFDLIYRLCKVDTTVLVRGENGTGKELVARAIHYNSPRKKGSFVAINCGAIPEDLMESELFGHEKGAFTGAIERKIGKFQLANNGTLFLDEVAELRPDMQVKLLRVLQEKTFTPVGSNREIKTNARIIAATNRNLEKMIDDQSFREDLFYRLNVLPIFLPPLRERIDDIEALTMHFVKRFNSQQNRDIEGITPEALRQLKSYRWPGNIRELENTIERAFILENSNQITVESLPPQVLQSKPEPLAKSERLNTPETDHSKLHQSYTGPLDFDQFKEQVERDFIINALRANHGKINKTVAQANIPKNTLLRKIKKYGINVKEYI